MSETASRKVLRDKIDELRLLLRHSLLRDHPLMRECDMCKKLCMEAHAMDLINSGDEKAEEKQK